MSLNHLVASSPYSTLDLKCNSIIAGTGIFNNASYVTLNAGTGIFASQVISPIYNTSGSTQTISVQSTPVIQLISTPTPSVFPFDDNKVVLGIDSGNSWKEVNSYKLSSFGAGLDAVNVPNGRVTQKEYQIISYNNVVQSIPNNVQTSLAFNTDTKTNWTSSRSDNTKFIGPVAGWYQVNYAVGWVSGQTVDAATQFYIAIPLNGALTSINSGTGGQSCITAGNTSTGAIGLQQNGSSVVYMNGTTDYVEVSVLHNYSGALNMGFTGTKGGASNTVSILYLHP